jgi:hypothetical protein
MLLALVGLILLLVAGFIVFVIDVLRGGTKRDRTSLAWQIIKIVGAGLIVLLLLSFPFGIPMLLLVAAHGAAQDGREGLNQV